MLVPETRGRALWVEEFIEDNYLHQVCMTSPSVKH